MAFEVDRNEHGRQTLHGGSRGFGVRPWSIVTSDARSVTLAIASEDGDMGFPGRLLATATYALLEPATLHVDFTATTTKPTPVSLAHHSYFNLDGSPDILDHHLLIAADFYTPTDDDLIPTGEVRSVAGTPYDFRTDRPIRFDAPGGPFAYDTNFVLRSANMLGHAATAWSPKSGVTLEAWTTEPGVQFYRRQLPRPCPAWRDGRTARSAASAWRRRDFPIPSTSRTFLHPSSAAGRFIARPPNTASAAAEAAGIGSAQRAARGARVKGA